MANIYKNEKTSLTTTALTSLYTVPSNSRAIVKSLNIAEDAGSTAVVKVTLVDAAAAVFVIDNDCLLYTSPSPRDRTRSRMPSSA